MKYLSLFSGIGGFEKGIIQAYDTQLSNAVELRRLKQPKGSVETDFYDLISESDIRQCPSCVGYSEIDKYATQIYQKHFPNHINYGDITKINEKELPDFDLLCGGFPCQSFSIAGKRGGFEDTRGTLFFDIARIVREKQPRLLLLENVKGLLSHDEGRTFSTIISTLDELGYDLQWQVLNSKYHGVPQNRERVFIIGHLRGTPRPEVFPIGGADHETNQPSGVRQTSDERLISRTLLARDYKDPKLVQLNQPKHSNDRVYGKDGLSPTLNTAQGGNRQPFIPEETKIRRLTPTECERLQGFPDNWTEGLSDTQRYKTLGNAVTVNVIREIIKKLL